MGDSRRTGEEGAVLAPDACRLVGELGWRGGEDGSVGDDVVRAVLGRVDEEALGNGGRMSDRRRRNDGPACDDDSAWKSTTDSYEGGDAFIAAFSLSSAGLVSFSISDILGGMIMVGSEKAFVIESTAQRTTCLNTHTAEFRAHDHQWR